ncbi:MAG: ACT domain-containing protein [Bulleidia sp.]|nr:ACT domain-containing protein [Bulleidia sp.]
MASDYLIVNKKILPDYLEQVIQARELLSSREVSTVTEAVKIAGISRNTYYKYKDYVFLPEEVQNARRAVLSLILKDEHGALSEVISVLSSLMASIITISQSVPVAGKASIIITLDISRITGSAEDMITRLKSIHAVTSAHLDAID